jgi:hypothetical protein
MARVNWNRHNTHSAKAGRRLRVFANAARENFVLMSTVRAALLGGSAAFMAFGVYNPYVRPGLKAAAQITQYCDDFSYDSLWVKRVKLAMEVGTAHVYLRNPDSRWAYPAAAATALTAAVSEFALIGVGNIKDSLKEETRDMLVSSLTDDPSLIPEPPSACLWRPDPRPNIP